MTIHRRGLLAASLAAVALAPFAASADGTLTGVTYLPPSYKALSYGSNGFVERLGEALPEGWNVDFYDSGTLLKADEQLPALRAGTIDFMFHTTSYITRSVPILGITGLPGVVEALYEHPDRFAMDGPLMELVNEQLAEDNLYMVSMGGNILEPEYIWSTEAGPIRSIADLDGKKVRVVSYEASDVVEDFGGAAVRIPSSETYLALQRGTVDAAVLNISTVIGRSLQEQLDVVYKLPLTAYGIGVFVLKDQWDGWPEDVRAAFLEAARWFDENGAKVPNDEIYPNEFWPTVDAAGIETVEASAESQAALDDAAEDVIEEWKAQVGEEVGQRAIDLAYGRDGS